MTRTRRRGPRRRDPSPAEIRRMCAEIQRGWSPAEEKARRRGIFKVNLVEDQPDDGWLPPVVRCPDFARDYSGAEIPSAPSCLASYKAMTKGRK